MIKIEGLHKSYIRGKEIIPNLNLEFGETGLTTIAGKSGCGKTTLLNIIGAMDLDFEGKVIIDGQDLKSKTYKEIVDYRNFTTAFVFQKNSLFEFLTVEENLKLCLNIQNNTSDISEALERVGLKGFEHKKVKALSGGEKQRVAIARSLIKNCKIIFADEPTSALDTKNAHKIFNLFREISKDKLVVLVTHDVKKAEMYSDRIIHFVDGVPVEDRMLHEVTNEVKELPERKTKKFALLPIFFNHLKKGLAINIFITLLLIAALTVTNLSVEQQIVKNEYDYFATETEVEFNTDRALITQIENNINLYDIRKATNVESAYSALQYVNIGDKKLDSADEKILSSYLEDYPVYYGAKDESVNKLVIEGVSNQGYITSTYQGNPVSWEKISASNYIYYLYNENVEYDLLDGSTLPTSDNEMLITDVVAYQYLENADIDVKSKDDLKEILNQDIVIYDINGIYNADKRNDETGDIDGKYYIGEPVEYKVVGVINTNTLGFYTYSTGSFRFNSQIKNQDDDRLSTFMNSTKSQPFGYVVLKKELAGTTNSNFYYNSFSPENITMSANDVVYELTNKNINSFIGSYDYTTNPAEMRDRELAGSSGIFKQYDLRGYEDDLIKDVRRRILYKSTTSSKLEGNEVLINVDLARQLYPSLNFIGNSEIQKSYEQIANTLISVEVDTGRGIKNVELEIVGITTSSSNGMFYVSDEMYTEIYSSIYNQAHSMTLDLKGYSLRQRKQLMEKLFSMGYVLSPVDVMPGAYLEFVEDRGETFAQIEYDGLKSLYYSATIEEVDGVYYFIHNGTNLGIVDSIDEPTIVYMSSSTVKRISLDDSYFINNVGNVSPYYLFSNYYTTDESNSGNYILEIMSSMYSFLLLMAVLISIGFIYLKENKERGTFTRLSMLGVRPRHVYLIHLITYGVISIVICLLTLLCTRIFVSVLNNLFTFNVTSFLGDIEINRVRLLFTSQTYFYTIIISLGLFIINMVTSIFVTRKNSK